MKKSTLFLGLFSLALLVFSAVIFLQHSIPIEKRVFYSSVEVAGSIGFDVNGSALIFGRITPGSNAMRSLILTNNYPYNVIVKINSAGKISDMLVYEDNIEIAKGETKKIPFTVYAYPNMKFGVYDGEVIVRTFPLSKKSILMPNY